MAKTRVKLVCEVCGGQYEQYPYRADTSRYCSKECWANRAPNKPCRNCGEMFKKTCDREYYCSRSCAQEHMVGPRAPNWKDGRSLDRERARDGPKLKKWRKRVFRRDEWKCQRCGATGEEMHAHHIKSYSDHPELRFEVSNGETLCVDCHGDEHGKDFSTRREKECPHCGTVTEGRGKNGRCRSCALKMWHASRE